MIRRTVLAFAVALGTILLAAPAHAAEVPCGLEPRTACFGIDSIEAALSTTQAGAHPDLTFTFEMKQDPESEPNEFGLSDGYATPRNIRFELPPGLIGNPNVLGLPQQCTVQELLTSIDGDGCPSGSQVGTSTIFGYELNREFVEPVYMMAPPGSDVVARLGLVAGVLPTFIDLRVRSESDYGLVAEISDAPVAAKLVRAETTTWGVPAAHSHDSERCTVAEAFGGCITSPSRPPGSRPLPLLTNPTRCGVPLEMRVGADSWNQPGVFDTKSSAFPSISGCDKLPFGPDLTVEPTSHAADAPAGADITIRLPEANGVDVLEPAQMRSLRVKLPRGLAFNPSAGDSLATCSPEQVRFGTRDASACPNASKLADTEFDIPVLARNLRGAVYLREPEPGHPFRIWIVADDLGLHVKLQGELEVDRQSGQITSVTSEIPQAPIREAKLEFKSGYRAPLVTPNRCGTFQTEYEFTPWSGGTPVKSSTPMTIDEGCDTGGFDPKLSAGVAEPEAGKHSPFIFTLTREDGEQNPEGLDITLPKGLAATFAGVQRCEGADAETGQCPAGSRIGRVVAAVGAGPTPLWVPQAGKRPTAIYLSGPYKGAPLSIVAVVPRQAGPFDFGDEVLRSAINVDPETAQATAQADPLPQLIEGIPIAYRAINVQLDRKGFTLNPTSCTLKRTEAKITSAEGAVARPASRFAATDCAKLGFKPRLSFRLFGGTRRGAHPKLRAVIRPRPGEANIGAFSITLPHSEFLDQSHIKTVCTRVQFKAHQCPPGSIYGQVSATTPLFDEPLSGDLYLRSSDHLLPDMVAVLRGPASLPVEVHSVGRIDSIKGGIRATFESIPDAPITNVVATFPGGAKGLLENSTNLCIGTHRVTAKMSGQNGKRATLRPELESSCGKSRKSAKLKRR